MDNEGTAAFGTFVFTFFFSSPSSSVGVFFFWEAGGVHSDTQVISEHNLLSQCHLLSRFGTLEHTGTLMDTKK